MNYRIVRIRGRSATSRQARLAAAKAWMADKGWALVDYAEDTGQALFEPVGDPPGAVARRILPWQAPPGHWGGLAEDWLTPRNLVLGGLAFAVLAALFTVNALQDSFDPEAAMQAAQERWWIVDADNLNVRELPDAQSPVVGMFQTGQRVLVGEVRDGWVQVEQPTRGWVAAKFLLPPPTDENEEE